MSFFGTHKCISLNVANSGPTIVHPSVSWLNKLLQLKYAFSFKLKKKKNLWPLFMDGVQLSRACKATIRRQFSFYQYVPRSL